MATATSPKADQPCLFTNAGDKEKAEPKKPKGTVFALPIDLDDDTLSEECAELHACVPEVAKAKADEKAAKNRGNAAKGLLGKFALPRFASEYATLGEMPPGPVTIVNHDGQSVTYVIQDKSQQNSLDDDQVAKLVALVGEEGVESITHEKEVYFFSSSTLAEQAAGVAAVKCPRCRGRGRTGRGVAAKVCAACGGTGVKERVAEVVFDVVSKAIWECDKLSTAQKEALIDKKTTRHLRDGMVRRVAEICGASATRIQSFFEAVGSSVVRYVKS